LDNLILMSSSSKMIWSFAQRRAFAIKLALITVMRHPELAYVSTLTLVLNAVSVIQALLKTHRPKSAIHRVYVKLMVVRLTAMVMEVADSRVVLQFALVLLVLRMTVLPSVPNALTLCLNIHNVKLDLSS
jgi:hypothetical protein